MAIKLLDKYPGQVDSGDPGYPWGRPRNTNTPGDGSGTPFEKEWVKDVYGFLQHLLAAGNITPSNIADKVGGSQYFDGLVAAFLKDPRTWQDEQTFQDIATFTADIRINTAILQGLAEVVYATPRVRKTMVPLTAFVPNPSISVPSSNWELIFALLGGQTWSISSAAGGDSITALIKLPADSTVTEVKAFIQTGAGSDIAMEKVGRVRYDVAGGGAFPTYTLAGLEPVQGPDTASVKTSGPIALTLGEDDLLQISFTAGTVVNGSYVTWVEVTRTEVWATGRSY